MFKTLLEWFGFDPVEPPRHPEIPTTPMRTIFDSELAKQRRRTPIARDLDLNARSLGRED